MSAATTPRRERKRTWRQDPAGRRARILDAASDEFGRCGFRATRLDHIAARAGVAEGTIYHWFGSKHGLLVAVGERYGDGLVDAAFGSLAIPTTPNDIATIVRNIFAYVRATPGALAAFLLASDPVEGGPAQEANRTRMVAAIQAQLDGWRQQGRIPRMDTRVSAELQFGLVESALRDCFLRGDGRDEVSYIREVTHCLAAYLGQPPAADG